MATAEEQKQAFCQACGKGKNEQRCIEIEGKKFCCSDCKKADDRGEIKEGAVCEFC